MAAFAPPVHRDRFLFSSILYADAGNDNHHPRASVAKLTALLRPEAPKGKKTTTPETDEPAKDPPWHFWTAQLIHYGLTSTKDKNAAKVRLLSALNGNQLEVPGWIQRLEAEMKKEWEAENKKLKKAAKEGGTPKPAKTKEPAAIAQASSMKEKAKKELARNTPAKEASTRILAAAATAPATSKSTTSKRKRDDIEPSDAVTQGKKAKPESAAEKLVQSPVQKVTPAKRSASQSSPPADDEPWPAPRRKIIHHDAWQFFDHDHLAHTRPSNAPHPRPYRVSCPDAEGEWDQKSIKEFYLAFSATEKEWWSRFEWGAFKGILILQRQPKRFNKAVGVPFKWRACYRYGNEEGDGEGKIFFDSSSTIKGEFYNFFREKPCCFRGAAIQYPQTPEAPYVSSASTPVLDQMRVEWSQMATVMQDAPAKKVRVKKENSAETKSSNASGSSRVVATDFGQDDIYLSGAYKIRSERMEETFLTTSYSPFRLILFTEESTGIWWAKFQWAMFDGIMKMDPGPTYETITHVHTLGWRIRDADTGKLTFGRHCTGEIRFDGKKRTLTGMLSAVPGVGRLDFEGQRIPGPRRVGGLAREWDQFVEEAYGHS